MRGNPYIERAIDPSRIPESAQVFAIAALAYEQRTANLIALMDHYNLPGQENVDIHEELRAEVFKRIGGQA